MRRARTAFRNEYSCESEVYSFAIILWELLTSDRPWKVDALGRPYNDAAIVMAVMSGERPTLPAYIAARHVVGAVDTRAETHALLVEMARRSWAHESHERPTFAELHYELREEVERELKRQGLASNRLDPICEEPILSRSASSRASTPRERPTIESDDDDGVAADEEEISEEWRTVS